MLDAHPDNATDKEFSPLSGSYTIRVVVYVIVIAFRLIFVIFFTSLGHDPQLAKRDFGLGKLRRDAVT